MGAFRSCGSRIRSMARTCSRDSPVPCGPFWLAKPPSVVVPIVVVSPTVAAVVARRVEPRARGDPDVEHAWSSGAGAPHGARAGRLEVERRAVEGELGACVDQ